MLLSQSMSPIQTATLVLQFTCFFLTLALFSRWFWRYTSNAIQASSDIDSIIAEESPLLDTLDTQIGIKAYSRHIRLLQYSFIAALMLFIATLGEFVYRFIATQPDAQSVALMFNCVLVMAVCGFSVQECDYLSSVVLVDHNRRDRLLSTLYSLTRSVTASWFAIILVNVTADILRLVYDEQTFASVYIESSKLALILLIASLFTLLRLWFPVPNESPEPATVSAWENVGKNLRLLARFIWPQTTGLQIRVYACMVILVVGRVVNVMVPVQYKVVIDALTANDGIDKRPFIAYGAILIFVSLRFLQGGVGLLTTLQTILWIPIGQNSTKSISVRMLEHLHNLSLTFHLSRKTGEVLRVMDRGTASVGALLSYILFNILPVFVDIAVAVVYFAVEFDWTFGLIVFATMSLYIALTIWITEWRTKFRRKVNDLDNACQTASVDSLLNFETVKYYANEQFEVEKFSKAIDAYQKADWVNTATLNVLNTAQNVTVTVGLLAGCLLCADRVVREQMTVGQFVLFMTYILQLYQPLNYFGTYYRVIQKNFIDMEQMMLLFEVPPEIQDKDNATDLKIADGGRVVFDDVSFSYDERTPVLNNVSFVVEPGSTVALVGPSGGGKSTIFRAVNGSVSIDGQDVKDLTQLSLRKQIGVIPQDSVLFNASITYNIQYGNLTASPDKIIEAAKQAVIHSKIMTFPDGYETVVGERGLRLSSGERQRLCIARTLLKDPAIILLDEATSALDNTTERHIQTTLESVYKSTALKTRTKIVIAHRLSTTMNADMILVVKNGTIVERGKHSELIKSGVDHGILLDGDEPLGVGSYYYMWMVQLKKNES